MYCHVLRILADGQKHTTNQLIKQLAISSMDLERAINLLSAYGIRFQVTANGTYQLIEPLELLDYSRILTALPLETQQRLANLEILDIIDSTNRYLLAMPQQTTPLACLAEYQTAGRGQHGRQWVSPYASGLCLSIKQDYSVFKQPLTGLNIALAVSVMQVLGNLGITEVGIKWPNDICWRGRKLAGLLLETRQNKSYEIVVGIGINVKIPFLNLGGITQPWVDLATVLGHSISRNVLAAMLIGQFCKTLLLYPSQGLSQFLPLWQHFDLSYGQKVILKIPSNRLLDRGIIAKPNLENIPKDPPKANSILEKGDFITGTAWGIDEQGALLLQVGNHIQRYLCGEVSLYL